VPSKRNRGEYLSGRAATGAADRRHVRLCGAGHQHILWSITGRAAQGRPAYSVRLPRFRNELTVRGRAELWLARNRLLSVSTCRCAFSIVSRHSRSCFRLSHCVQSQSLVCVKPIRSTAPPCVGALSISAFASLLGLPALGASFDCRSEALAARAAASSASPSAPRRRRMLGSLALGSMEEATRLPGCGGRMDWAESEGASLDRLWAGEGPPGEEGLELIDDMVIGFQFTTGKAISGKLSAA
jgi:hypothetical protein